jgi:plastocyanin
MLRRIVAHRMRARSPLLLVVSVGAVASAPGPAPAHPGHFARVDVAGYAFSPATVTIEAGEEVLWSWSGLDRDHSVTAEPGQAEAWDSDPAGVSGPAPADRGFSHVFRTPGTYSYVCKVHAGMRGSVIVTPVASADLTPPRVTRLRVAGRARTRLDVRFRLDEAAEVELALDRLGRRGGAKRVLTRVVRAESGAVRAALRVGRLGRGAHRLSVLAIDGNDNAGDPVRARVALVR